MRPRVPSPRFAGTTGLALALLVTACDAEGGPDPGKDTAGESGPVHRLDPAGHPIVFASNRAGDFDLWAIRPDGSDPQRLTSTIGDEAFPVWSPDGSQLAYACSRATRKGGGEEPPRSICLLGDGSTDIRVLPRDSDVSQLVTSWSPDGTRLLVTVVRPGQDVGTLVVMDADGSRPRTLATEGAWGDWSPDGTRILYVAPNAARDGFRLWVMNRDGTDKRPLPGVSDRYEATWSSDGEQIAYITPRGNPGPDDEDPVHWNEDIGVMRADGSGAHHVATAPGNDHWPPAWSPDSTRIVYSADGESNEGELTLLDLRTGTSRQLTDNDADDLTVDWLRVARSDAPSAAGWFPGLRERAVTGRVEQE